MSADTRLFLTIIAAHCPQDVVAGLAVGAAAGLVGFLLLRRPLVWRWSTSPSAPSPATGADRRTASGRPGRELT